jgi:hypothetical protein
VYFSFHIRSIIRSFALRERGFFVISSEDGAIGFLVIFVARPASDIASQKRFEMRSSRLWNEMIARRAPGARTSNADARPRSTFSSSLFTAMRIPWNVRVA